MIRFQKHWIPLLVIFLFLTFLLWFSLQFSSSIEHFDPTPPPYIEPPATGGTAQSACATCANSNPLQNLKEEIEKRYDSILTMLKDRDIKMDDLSQKVKENTTYISKMKMVEQQLNNPSSSSS